MALRLTYAQTNWELLMQKHALMKWYNDWVTIAADWNVKGKKINKKWITINYTPTLMTTERLKWMPIYWVIYQVANTKCYWIKTFHIIHFDASNKTGRIKIWLGNSH